MRRALTLAERAVVAMIQMQFKMQYGTTIDFTAELVRHHGRKGVMRYFKESGAVYAEVFHYYGEMEMHLVSSFASFWNGCDYCAYGNLYAYNLWYFEKTGQLFPVDERMAVDLLRKRDGEILKELDALLGASHQNELRRIVRQYELKQGDEPTSDEDRILVKSIAAYDWLNECSIMVEGPCPPLGRIGKNKKLLKAYHEARAAERHARDTQRLQEAAGPLRQSA